MHLLKFEWYRVSCSDELVVLNTHCLVLLQIYINFLWPSDAIWRHASGWTLTQVMSCCLMAQSHYLDQYWHIVGFLWHSLETNFTLSAQAVLFEFKNCILTLLPHLPGGNELMSGPIVSSMSTALSSLEALKAVQWTAFNAYSDDMAVSTTAFPFLCILLASLCPPFLMATHKGTWLQCRLAEQVVI